MDLFRMFRRRPPICSVADLADFIDQNAALLVQRGIYEYSRARAGHYAKVLFAEPGFLHAVEQSRWRAYPLGLAMVGEMVDAALRLLAAGEPRAVAGALADLVLSVFDRYPMPAALGRDVWSAERAELARRLAGIALHKPKRVIDIPEPYAESYFDLMPIHEKLRGRDFDTTQNYLKVTLCNIHAELSKRVEGNPLTQHLPAG